MADFETIEDAAEAARMATSRLEDASKLEFASVIYQDPKTGKFKFTEPQGQGKRGSFSLKVRIPKGSMRAVFHNHPASLIEEDQRRLFSQNDLDVARSLNVPSFIGVDQGLLSFDPAKPTAIKRVRTGSGRFKQQEAAVGQPVLAQIPVSMLPKRRETVSELFARGTK